MDVSAEQQTLATMPGKYQITEGYIVYLMVLNCLFSDRGFPTDDILCFSIAVTIIISDTSSFPFHF